MHHVRQPYGMAILAALALLFVWYLWTVCGLGVVMPSLL